MQVERRTEPFSGETKLGDKERASKLDLIFSHICEFFPSIELKLFDKNHVHLIFPTHF